MPIGEERSREAAADSVSEVKAVAAAADSIPLYHGAIFVGDIVADDNDWPRGVISILAIGQFFNGFSPFNTIHHDRGSDRVGGLHFPGNHLFLVSSLKFH